MSQNNKVFFEIQSGPIAWVVAQCVDYIDKHGIIDPELQVIDSKTYLTGEVNEVRVS